MSVWTKVQAKALNENVDMEVLKEGLAQMGVTLDFGVTNIENSYGNSKVTAALRKNGNLTSLGIVVGRNKGVTLVGDTWRSGIVGDKQANKLSDLIAQVYQKTKVKKQLELEGWMVKEVKKEDKIVLECIQY